MSLPSSFWSSTTSMCIWTRSSLRKLLCLWEWWWSRMTLQAVRRRRCRRVPRPKKGVKPIVSESCLAVCLYFLILFMFSVCLIKYINTTLFLFSSGTIKAGKWLKSWLWMSALSMTTTPIQVYRSVLMNLKMNTWKTLVHSWKRQERMIPREKPCLPNRMLLLLAPFCNVIHLSYWW